MRYASVSVLQLTNLFFEFLNEPIKLCDVASVVALFMLAEAEKVGDILRSPAVEVELIFFRMSWGSASPCGSTPFCELAGMPSNRSRKTRAAHS